MFGQQTVVPQASYPPGFDNWPLAEQDAYRRTVSKIVALLLEIMLTEGQTGKGFANQDSRPFAQAFMTTAGIMCATAPTPQLRLEMLEHFEKVSSTAAPGALQ